MVSEICSVEWILVSLETVESVMDQDEVEKTERENVLNVPEVEKK